MIKHALTVVAYIFATFLTQATSHFAVNAEHYASITYMRAQPIMPLGLLAMLIQGVARTSSRSPHPRSIQSLP